MPTLDSLPSVETLCRQAESVFRVLARRDLDGVPLYIIPQSSLPEDRGRDSVCDEFTTPSLDLYLRDVIGSRWAGRGPCTVIRDEAADGSMDACHVAVAFFSVALHELAHILTRSRMWVDRDRTDATVLASEAVTIGQHVAGPEPMICSLIPFYGHRVCFIRAAWHLCYRAKEAGILVSPPAVCCGSNWTGSRN